MDETFIATVLRELKRMQSLAEAAMIQLTDEQFFSVPAPGDNSVAVIVKHVGGNLMSRWIEFLASDGEKPGRDRDQEFLIGPEDSRERLSQRWLEGWTALAAALTPLADSDLSRRVTVRGEALTVFQAMMRQLSLYAYHVGQIVYVAKHHRGAAWRSLSIPLGRSADFNREPAPYV